MNGFALKEKILEVKNNDCFVDHFTTHKMLPDQRSVLFHFMCKLFWQVLASKSFNSSSKSEVTNLNIN